MAITSPAVTADAPRSRRPRLFWSRLHFVVRLLGLTGVLATLLGLSIIVIQLMLAPENRSLSLLDVLGLLPDQLRQVTLEQAAQQRHLALLLAGAAVALIALLVEAIVILCFTATRRSAFGFNAVLQGVLAALLLIGINAWSYYHSVRVDFTRDQQFTLPPEVRKELAQLDPASKTTIIVYQRHRTFGTLTGKDNKDKQDEFESAAESKVVEKVRDLAEVLRASSARQLRVEVLDTQAKDYKPRERLEDLTKDAPELRKAIESAPESSLFFYTRGENGRSYIQRLSFNDFYLLDKTASQEDRDGRGNLVLLYQGVQPLVNRVLHLEEKRPRIGIAVIHPVLSSAKDHDWGLKGMREALEAHGFQVEDIVLKKWSRFAPPSAAAATVDESALERLDEREQSLERLIAGLKRERPTIVETLNIWNKAVEDPKTREDLTRKLADQLGDRKLTAEMARFQADLVQASLDNLDKVLPVYQQRLDELRDEKSKLNVPALKEQQRMTDVRAKMDRLLTDCDLLIVPRMTLRNLAEDFENIPNRLYKLDEGQVQAVKEFLKSGKPVLACFGPTNRSPEEGPGRPEDLGPDGLETLLGDLGVKFGKETVLFDAEVEALGESRAGTELGGAQVAVPPLLLDWPPGAGQPIGTAAENDSHDLRPNRIRESLRLIARALGKDEAGKSVPLDIHIRHPRPIYYVPTGKTRPDRAAEFLMVDPRSWNEDQPFPTADSVPQFEKPKKRDAGGALAEESKDPYAKRRRGPFPIGVAFQTTLPQKWYDSTSDKSATVRLAVIGQGGFFTGKGLPPAQEELFVTTINWLLGRDDRLPSAERTWSYPRVNDTIPPHSEMEYLWLGGVVLGLPALSAFFGFVVLLFRRLR